MIMDGCFFMEISILKMKIKDLVCKRYTGLCMQKISKPLYAMYMLGIYMLELKYQVPVLQVIGRRV